MEDRTGSMCAESTLDGGVLAVLRSEFESWVLSISLVFPVGYGGIPENRYFLPIPFNRQIGNGKLTSIRVPGDREPVST